MKMTWTAAYGMVSAKWMRAGRMRLSRVGVQRRTFDRDAVDHGRRALRKRRHTGGRRHGRERRRRTEGDGCGHRSLVWSQRLRCGRLRCNRRRRSGGAGGLHVQQLTDGDEVEPFGQDGIQRVRHCINRRRMKIVAEEDGPVACAIDQTARDHTDSGTFPVLGIDAPQDGAVTKLIVETLLERCVGRAARRPEQAGMIACDVHQRLVRAANLPLQAFLRQARDRRVRHRMIPDLMPLSEDAPNDVRILPCQLAHHKKGGFDVPLLEDVQQPRGVLRVRAVIKRDREIRSVDMHLGIGVPRAGRRHLGNLVVVGIPQSTNNAASRRACRMLDGRPLGDGRSFLEARAASLATREHDTNPERYKHAR